MKQIPKNDKVQLSPKMANIDKNQNPDKCTSSSFVKTSCKVKTS